MKLKYTLLFLFATFFVMASARDRGPVARYDIEDEIQHLEPKEYVQSISDEDEVFDRNNFDTSEEKEEKFIENPKEQVQETTGIQKPVVINPVQNKNPENDVDAFAQNAPNNPFREKDIGDSAYEKAPYAVASMPKIKREKPLKVIGTRTQDSMLIINGDDIKVNPKIFNDDLCRDCLQMTEYLYLATKRYDKDHRVYPGAFLKETDLPRPPTYDTLMSRGIEIFAPIMGVNGGIEEAIVGMLAYRLQQRHLEIFIALEGSQGEPFEFLEGIGGSSWRTNFLSNKKDSEAQKFNLDKKYEVLSIHEGYGNKILSSRPDLIEKIRALCKYRNIKDISEYDGASDNVTQQDIDNWRGFTIDVYIFGHSQGGGLTQAMLIAMEIGRMFYGYAFDNKTFNTIHLICMSPARAIGDVHTLCVILDVWGIGNIFCFCSPIDIIPCLPLGHNIDKRPLLKLRATVGLMILKAISLVLPKKWSDFISAISSTKFNYEELPIFAYVDYGDVLVRYCDESIKVYREYLGIMKEKGAKVDEKQWQKKIDSCNQIKKKIPEIRKRVTSMQENYFKAHTSNILTSKYYALKAVHYLRKLLQIVPIEDLIASQHWGAPVLLQNKDSKRQIWIETLFNAGLIVPDIQKAIDRGIEYKQWKGEIVPENKSKTEMRIESMVTNERKIEPMVTN